MAEKKQQLLSGEFEPNWKRYRKASEPHASMDAAEKAMQAFFDEVAELRVKHQIRDVLLICNVCLIEKDDTETVASGTIGFGTQSLFESMAACAYGTEKARNEERIRRLLSSKCE